MLGKQLNIQAAILSSGILFCAMAYAQTISAPEHSLRIPEMSDIPAAPVLDPLQTPQAVHVDRSPASPPSLAASPVSTVPAPQRQAEDQTVRPTPAGTAASRAGAAASAYARQIVNGIRIILPSKEASAPPGGAIPALQAFLRAIPDGNTSRITVSAYASGTTEDVSTPRRLSLQRARAVQEILVGAGADPRRIDLRPMGIATTDANIPDRIDITLGVTPR